MLTKLSQKGYSVREEDAEIYSDYDYDGDGDSEDKG